MVKHRRSHRNFTLLCPRPARLAPRSANSPRYASAGATKPGPDGDGEVIFA